MPNAAAWKNPSRRRRRIRKKKVPMIIRGRSRSKFAYSEPERDCEPQSSNWPGT
jgi:hypothetical protein